MTVFITQELTQEENLSYSESNAFIILKTLKKHQTTLNICAMFSESGCVLQTH